MGTRVVSYPEALDLVDYDPLLRYLAHDIAEVERQIVPVDTGALRDGIYEGDPEGRSVRVYSGRHVTRLSGGRKGRASGEWHAAPDDPKVPLYVERGTSKMRAQPYMRPALYRYRSPS